MGLLAPKGLTVAVFYDEPDRAEEHIGRKADISAAGGDKNADFVMMSHCRFIVIGHGTFSWWAAWLGSSTDKFFIAPNTS
jgi:hypothetical protein